MKKILYILATGILIFSVNGCGKTDNNQEKENKQLQRERSKEILNSKDSKTESERNLKPCCRAGGNAQEVVVEDLSHWQGIWNSITQYSEKIDMKDAYEEKAKRISIQENKEINPEEIKKDFLRERNIEIASIRIQGDEIEILDKKQDHDCHINCEVKSKAKYNLVGTKTRKVDNTQMRWFIFEADKDSDYKYMALTTMYEDESLKHFHLKYSNDDIEKLIENDDVLPTMVKSTSMMSAIKKEIAR